MSHESSFTISTQQLSRRSWLGIAIFVANFVGCGPQTATTDANKKPAEQAKPTLSTPTKPETPAVGSPAEAIAFQTPTKNDEASARGLAWLVKQQAKDGGWHSETYGAMRAGAATTSLALYTLGEQPQPVREKYRDSIQLAWKKFLDPYIEEKTGRIVNHDGSPDTPLYDNALVLAVLKRLDVPSDPAKDHKMVHFVLNSQLGETRKFTTDSPHFGGWDLVGIDGPLEQSSGTTISLGCYATEALRLWSGRVPEQVFKDARTWAERARGPHNDGGFVFCADMNSDNNKAGSPEGKTGEPYSYGTATADAVRMLIACGAKPDDPLVQGALKWLADRPGIDAVPGFEKSPPEAGWKEGLRYYYAFSLAKTLPYQPAEVRTRQAKEITGWLLKQQQPDGSWKNESATMRENDPLIATGLALLALEYCRPERWEAANKQKN